MQTRSSAWQNGHKDIVSWLIDRGAVVDKTNTHEESALFGAAEVS